MLNDKRKGQQRRMLARAEGMECSMSERERPIKEKAGEGGGNGILNKIDRKYSIGKCR